MRRILAVIFVLIMSASADGFVVPEAKTVKASKFILDGGLSIEFCGIVRDLESKGDVRECVFTLFMVTSEKDTRLDVKSEAVYDSFGRRFSGPVGASIAGNGVPSEIIAEVPTMVWFVHRVPVRVREFPKFSRMKFTFNGHEVELRGESSQSWTEWKSRAPAENEALSVWIESGPSLAEMYRVMMNAQDLSGTAEFGGHHYKVFYKSVSWYEAKSKCESLGGHLCTITSREENNFVTSFVKANRNIFYWLGASDERYEGTWEWVTGEKFSFTLWNSGEPNGGRRENFLQMTTYWNNSWGWNDAAVNAGSKDAYICEWDY